MTVRSEAVHRLQIYVCARNWLVSRWSSKHSFQDAPGWPPTTQTNRPRCVDGLQGSNYLLLTDSLAHVSTSSSQHLTLISNITLVVAASFHQWTKEDSSSRTRCIWQCYRPCWPCAWSPLPPLCMLACHLLERLRKALYQDCVSL